MDSDFAYLLAVIGGDGTLYENKNSRQVSISDCNYEFHFILLEKFKKLYNVIPKIKFIKQRNTYYTLICNKNILKEFAQYYPTGKEKTYKCRIPLSIFEDEIKVQLTHLAGWIDAEGYPKLQKQKINEKLYVYPRVILESVNKNLVDDIYKLSCSVKIESTKPHLCKRNYKDNRLPRYGIEWNGKKCIKLTKIMLHPSKLSRLLKYISLQGDQIKGFT